MKNLAPYITRERVLIEGFYKANVNQQIIKKYFKEITKKLKLRVYGKPIIHATSGQGKEMNQGYDAFIPLIDSGIYLGAWANEKFLSIVIYTCKKFNEKTAVSFTKNFFKIEKIEWKSF